MFMLLALAGLAQAGSIAGTHELSKKTQSVKLTSVEGNIEITEDALLDLPVIDVMDHRPGRTCQLVFETDKKGLTLVAFGPKDQEDPKDCRADFDVRLPPGMAIEVELGLGNLKTKALSSPVVGSVGKGRVMMDGQSGSVSLDLGEGDYELTDVSGDLVLNVGNGKILGTATGPLVASVGNGKVKLEGMTGDVTADTGVGDILLTFTAAPAMLSLNAGKGHVVVDLPTGTKVQPHLSAFQGSATCDLPEGDGVMVTAVSGIGSVRVH